MKYGHPLWKQNPALSLSAQMAVAGGSQSSGLEVLYYSDRPGRVSQGWDHCLHYFSSLPTQCKGWGQVVFGEPARAPWPSSWPRSLGSGCNNCQVRKYLQKTLSPVKFHTLERRFVWLTSPALPLRVSLSWDPMLRCLILHTIEKHREACELAGSGPKDQTGF